jgi:hypothetical protein
LKSLQCPIGDDVDGTIDHLDGCLVNGCVSRHRHGEAHFSALAVVFSGHIGLSRCG